MGDMKNRLKAEEKRVSPFFRVPSRDLQVIRVKEGLRGRQGKL